MTLGRKYKWPSITFKKLMKAYLESSCTFEGEVMFLLFLVPSRVISTISELLAFYSSVDLLPVVRVLKFGTKDVNYTVCTTQSQKHVYKFHKRIAAGDLVTFPPTHFKSNSLSSLNRDHCHLKNSFADGGASSRASTPYLPLRGFKSLQHEKILRALRCDGYKETKYQDCGLPILLLTHWSKVKM